MRDKMNRVTEALLELQCALTDISGRTDMQLTGIEIGYHARCAMLCHAEPGTVSISMGGNGPEEFMGVKLLGGR